jgi:putative colanic acid biosynthesis acetyltransferase WcaF
MSQPEVESSPPPSATALPPSSPPPAGSSPSGGIFQQLDRSEVAPYRVGERLLRAAWTFVNQTIWRLPRGWGWRRWLLRRFGAKIGRGAVFRASATVFHPWLFEIGDHSTLGPGVVIYNLGPVKIGSHTTISQDCYVCAGTHDYTIPHLPLRRTPITIGSGVWVAAQAFIGPGVTVGDNCVIGARAVVAKDIAAGMIAAGNPAHVIKARPMGSPST